MDSNKEEIMDESFMDSSIDFENIFEDIINQDTLNQANNESDLSNILDLNNISTTNPEKYTENDIGLSRHLELLDANSSSDTEFKTYIQSKFKYPHILIKRENFVSAHIKNLFSLVTEGTIPLMLECGGQTEEIYKLELTTSNIINLKRIFSTDIIYRPEESSETVLEPLDLLVNEDIF